MNLANVIDALVSDGVITITNAITLHELDRLQRIYDSSWNEIKEQLACLDWKRINFFLQCRLILVLLEKIYMMENLLLVILEMEIHKL